MLFSLSIFFFFLLCHDLVGFGPFCVNKTHPLAFIARDSQIPSPADLSLYKDVGFSYSPFTFFDWGFIAGKRIFFLDNLCITLILLSAHMIAEEPKPLSLV
ncbi:hypothetical protein VNO80_22157 [Phaseolus coccineus]|uniref:Secreted protein n=1 Tax=Phaseolus coccineus TaxID=3886 RepID=A0AAN9M553_PHACN